MTIRLASKCEEILLPPLELRILCVQEIIPGSHTLAFMLRTVDTAEVQNIHLVVHPYFVLRPRRVLEYLTRNVADVMLVLIPGRLCRRGPCWRMLMHAATCWCKLMHAC